MYDELEGVGETDVNEEESGGVATHYHLVHHCVALILNIII